MGAATLTAVGACAPPQNDIVALLSAEGRQCGDCGHVIPVWEFEEFMGVCESCYGLRLVAERQMAANRCWRAA